MNQILSPNLRRRLRVLVPTWRESPNLYRLAKGAHLAYLKVATPRPVPKVDREAFQKNPFIYTERITFEISKQCGLACTHEKCPLWVDYVAVRNQGGNIKDYNASARVLDDALIEATLKIIGKYEYAGVLSFHRYNEPLFDLDRFRKVLSLCKTHAPLARPRLWTNVSVLKQRYLDEFLESGLTNVVVSAYSPQWYKTAQELRVHAKAFCAERGLPEPSFEILKFLSGGDDLDDRIEIYDRAISGLPHGNIYEPCSSPLRLVDIDAKGNVALCCYDWKSENTYGNIADKPLDEIMRNSTMLDDYVKLMSGKREKSVCMACKTARQPETKGAFGRPVESE